MRPSRRSVVTNSAALAVLTACGSSGANAPAAGSAAKKTGAVVVHSRAGTADHSAFQQTRIPLFKQQFPNVEVRYEDIPGDQIRTKLLVMAAGGDIGDLA